MQWERWWVHYRVVGGWEWLGVVGNRGEGHGVQLRDLGKLIWRACAMKDGEKEPVERDFDAGATA